MQVIRGDQIEVVSHSDIGMLGEIGEVVFISEEKGYCVAEFDIYIGVEEGSPVIVDLDGLKVVKVIV